PGDLVAIRLALGGALEIEQTGIGRGDLHADVAELGRPAAHALERIERRALARELRKKDRRSLHRVLLVAPRAARRTCGPGAHAGGSNRCHLRSEAEAATAAS